MSDPIDQLKTQRLIDLLVEARLSAAREASRCELRAVKHHHKRGSLEAYIVHRLKELK